jgi:hypothetical protein
MDKRRLPANKLDTKRQDYERKLKEYLSKQLRTLKNERTK